MIILTAGENVSVVVRDNDLLNGTRTFFAQFGTGYYDPRDNFRPCFNFPEGRRRLYDKYADEYNTLIPEAEKMFDRMAENYNKVIDRKANAKAPAPGAPAPSSLGSQLETMMIQVLAQQSADKVIETMKPMLDKHIFDTYGMLPQKHEIILGDKKTEIEGVTHEEFDTVLGFVSADIPVFLSGAAGTGKNVICKQVAEALGLQFFFSNAVTQEHKLTGFIDANGTFHETQFYKAFTEGGLFMLDEMDASIPEVLIILNAAIANRYFDFPTGRVDAHEDFRLIAAGNTYGTGADMEYTGRFQLDAASLDRFALVEIDYSRKIEEAIACGNLELVNFVDDFRAATKKAGIKHLATYRSIERIRKLDGVMDRQKVLKTCLLKGMESDDIRMVCNEMTVHNAYYDVMRGMA